MSTRPDPVSGRVLEDQIVEPRGYYAREVRKDEVLRIVNVEGKQVADLVAFNLNRLQDKLWTPVTVVMNRSVFPGVGYTLFSGDVTKLLTIVADTCGTHDMLAGACSRFINEYRYHIPNTLNCRDNLAAAVKPWGITWQEVPFNMNVFMNCPIRPDGTYTIEECKARAGDYVDFKAEIDVLVAISNCPQEHNPCNAYRPKSLRVIHYRP